MRKVVLAFAITAISFVTANAQESGLHLAGGLRLAKPIGDFELSHSFGAGAELQAEYMFSDKVGATFNTGYTRFIGKDIMGTKVPGMGYIPMLAGVRFYPASQFFVGAKVGYGLLMMSSNGQSATEGGINYEPQIGYNGEKFQIGLGYNGLGMKSEEIVYDSNGMPTGTKETTVTMGSIALTAVFKFN